MVGSAGDIRIRSKLTGSMYLEFRGNSRQIVSANNDYTGKTDIYTKMDLTVIDGEFAGVRVNSPDGTSRFGQGMVTVYPQAKLTIEAAGTKYVGRHVYTKGLTLSTGSFLIIGETAV